MARNDYENKYFEEDDDDREYIQYSRDSREYGRDNRDYEREYDRDREHCNCKNYCKEKVRCYCKNREVLLNSNTGSAGPLPVTTIPLTNPIPIVSTSVDNDLGDADTLLTFTSIITLPLGAVVSLNFQLLRSYNGGTPVPIGSSYNFSRTAALLESDSFTFQYFDSDVEKGFYTYSVELAPSSSITVAAGVTITSATLTALTVKED